MELYQGVRNKSEFTRLQNKLKSYNIIHYNDRSSKIAVELTEKYHLSHGLLIPDAIIAATALTYNLKLFTYNVKDFRFIPGLTLY
ncbi:MAG: type II toxin-antitoxin system VapC family toxin [Prolixibacteraceae bacterium]|nr:type II toxin-antitoxin system VapC family toxin [Prolixibacteraceae bacterium]